MNIVVLSHRIHRANGGHLSLDQWIKRQFLLALAAASNGDPAPLEAFIAEVPLASAGQREFVAGVLMRLRVQREKHSAVQRARRAGKNVERDARVRRHHARLKAANGASATSDTAAEFNLSTRRVRQILKG